MMKFVLVSLSFFFIVSSCDKKNTLNFDERSDSLKYSNYKKQFDSNVINQFPEKIDSKEYFILSNTNIEKNDVGLFLVEYNLSENEMRKVLKKNSVFFLKKYSSKDSCLFKVNRFETIETRENYKIVEIYDSSLISNPCFKKSYPIPNFIDYSIATKKDFWENENFDIYVLEAKSGNHFKEYDMQPNPQMPIQWQNGYSKGIAVSEEKKTLIYWSIIW